MPLSLVTSAGKVVTRRFLLSFYGLAKFKGLLFSRARIGVEIIYLSSVFVGHGGNRAYLRCKRVLLTW